MGALRRRLLCPLSYGDAEPVYPAAPDVRPTSLPGAGELLAPHNGDHPSGWSRSKNWHSKGRAAEREDMSLLAFRGVAGASVFGWQSGYLMSVSVPLVM